MFSLTGDLDRAIQQNREAAVKAEGREPVEMEHWNIHDLRSTFSTLACEVLGAEIAVVDHILNHVATATTSKIMRTYNKSELFEPRKRVLQERAELIEREAAARDFQSQSLKSVA